ncbi:MAG: cupin domain-containing protein, partial [Candidatus Binatia bacterium]
MKAETRKTQVSQQPPSDRLTLEQFHEAVLQEQLTPLWIGVADRLREPQTHIQPYLWRWKELRHRVMQSRELIPLGAEGAERRVLTLRNPGIPGPRMGTTHTLVAAIQLIEGTEVAPSHRHTMAALRFVIEGEGACTVVNGEPESMEPRDLLLTPNWYWHGHFSEHPEPMIWMDGLDVPLVYGLGAAFQEDYPSPDRSQPITAPRDESIRRYSAGGLLPVGERTTDKNSPLLNFSWAQTE